MALRVLAGWSKVSLSPPQLSLAVYNWSLQLQEEQVHISSIKFQLSENTDDFWCIDGAADSIDP